MTKDPLLSAFALGRPRQEADSDPLIEIRKKIYLGEGYHVIRGYIEPVQAAHMVDFWSGHSNKKMGRVRHQFYPRRGSPNITRVQNGRVFHRNFFWNAPNDPFTYSTSWELQRLRNLLEGNPPCKDYLAVFAKNAHERRACCFTVTGNTHEQEHALHIDSIDHSALQMSLVLTKHGVDYDKGGFLFRTNSGTLMNLNADEALNPGDLILFKYANEHGVLATETSPGQKGFWRITLPLEAFSLSTIRHRFLSLAKARLKALRKDKAATTAELSRDFSAFDAETIPLTELALEEGMAPWEIYHPSGFFACWRQLGDWQLDILKEHGMKPGHHVLDIGCGVQRLGLKLVDFLDDDRYCGVDAVAEFIRLGHRFQQEVGRTGKTYHLAHDSHFEFQRFNRQFDYAMAQSVLTHLSHKQIEDLFRSLKRSMKPGGTFIWTIIRSFKETERTFIHSGNVPMTNTYHGDLSFYEGLARSLGFKFRDLGSGGHVSQSVCMATF